MKVRYILLRPPQGTKPADALRIVEEKAKLWNLEMCRTSELSLKEVTESGEIIFKTSAPYSLHIELWGLWILSLESNGNKTDVEKRIKELSNKLDDYCKYKILNCETEAGWEYVFYCEPPKQKPHYHHTPKPPSQKSRRQNRDRSEVGDVEYIENLNRGSYR